jgi:hypothetical protein
MIYVLIILAYSLACNLDLIAYLQHGKTREKMAFSFARRNQFLLLTRLFVFVLPPLLGYLTLSGSANTLIKVAYLSNITAASTMLLTFLFYSKLKFKTSYMKMNTTTIISSLIFAIYLNAPFIGNVVASTLPEYDVIIVQLIPIVSAITTIYVVYIFDPKIAKILDSDEFHVEQYHSLIIEKLFGRIISILPWILVYLAHVS